MLHLKAFQHFPEESSFMLSFPLSFVGKFWRTLSVQFEVNTCYSASRSRSEQGEGECFRRTPGYFERVK